MSVVPALEKDLEKAATRAARLAGWYSYKLSSNPRGYPDRVFARPGRCVFIEFKSARGVPSPHQEVAAKILRDAGNEVYLVRSMEEFKQIMDLK